MSSPPEILRWAATVSFAVMNEFRGRGIILSQAMRNWSNTVSCTKYPSTAAPELWLRPQAKTWGYHQRLQGIPQVLYFGGFVVLGLCYPIFVQASPL